MGALNSVNLWANEGVTSNSGLRRTDRNAVLNTLGNKSERVETIGETKSLQSDMSIKSINSAGHYPLWWINDIVQMVYTFGSANPRSFSRGKRGLAGSMIFTLFDRSALYQLMRDSQGRWDYYAHEGEEYSLQGNNNVWDWAQQVSAGLVANGGARTNRRHAEYMDQVMPFNVTLIAQNKKTCSIAA